MASVFFIAAVSAVLGVTAVNYAAIGQAVFDLTVIILVFFSLKKGYRLGAALGIFFGVCNGLFGTGPFWLDAFLYCLTGFLVGYIGKWLYKENFLTFIIILLCAMAFIYFFKYIVAQTAIGLVDYTVRLFLPQALYTVFVSGFLFFFLKRLGFRK